MNSNSLWLVKRLHLVKFPIFNFVQVGRLYFLKVLEWAVEMMKFPHHPLPSYKGFTTLLIGWYKKLHGQIRSEAVINNITLGVKSLRKRFQLLSSILPRAIFTYALKMQLAFPTVEMEEKFQNFQGW